MVQGQSWECQLAMKHTSDLQVNLLVMVNVVALVTVYVLEPAVKVVGVGQTVT